MRDRMAEILASQGHRGTTAADGAQGLRRLRETPPGLIVLDLMMPVLEGWAFVEVSDR